MFLRYNKLEQLEFKLEKLLGFRKMQEKLENELEHWACHHRDKVTPCPSGNYVIVFGNFM